MPTGEPDNNAPSKRVSLFALLRLAPQFIRSQRHVLSFLRLLHTYIGVKAGLFELLSTGSSFEDLVGRHRFDQELLKIWLNIATVEGLVRKAGDTYTLTKKGFVYSSGSPTHASDFTTLLVDYWADVFRKVPDFMKSSTRYVLEESPQRDFGNLVARLSRATDLLAFRVLQRLPQVKKRGCRVLDVGCGLGSYLIFLAKINPTLEGVGVEIAEDVAASATEAVEREGLSKRIRIIRGDIREVELDKPFNLCIFSLIYYYLSPDEKHKVLTKLRDLLADDGSVAVMVPVLSKNWKSRADSFPIFFHFLQRASSNLYGIPTKQEVHDVLTRAGLTNIKTYRLVIGGPFYYFVGTKRPS